VAITKVYFRRSFENDAAFIHPNNVDDAAFISVVEEELSLGACDLLEKAGFIEVDFCEVDVDEE
jgi:hypothetical protein